MIATKRTAATQPAAFPRQTHIIIISDVSAFAKRTYGGRNSGDVHECVCDKHGEELRLFFLILTLHFEVTRVRAGSAAAQMAA